MKKIIKHRKLVVRREIVVQLERLELVGANAVQDPGSADVLCGSSPRCPTTRTE